MSALSWLVSLGQVALLLVVILPAASLWWLVCWMLGHMGFRRFQTDDALPPPTLTTSALAAGEAGEAIHVRIPQADDEPADDAAGFATPTSYDPAPIFSPTVTFRGRGSSSLLFRVLWAWFPSVMRAVLTPAHVPTAEQRRQLFDAVIEAPAVVEAAKRRNMTRAERQRTVGAMLNTMVAGQHMSVIRLLAWVMEHVFAMLYPFGIHVKNDEIARLERYRGRAPWVIVPTHKSHLDYLLVTYVCFMRGLPLPHVVAGINLNIWIIGRILRWGGAFFIRRTFSGDVLYASVFAAYVRELLKRNLALECFIEGGRSRSGKVLPPKVGFLHGVVEAVLAGEVRDVYLVPVSLNYDRIVENDSHISELTGSSKSSESLVLALSSMARLVYRALTGKLCLGSIDIGFAQPISVRDFLVDNAIKVTAGRASATYRTADEARLSVIDVVSRALPAAGSRQRSPSTASELSMDRLSEEDDGSSHAGGTGHTAARPSVPRSMSLQSMVDAPDGERPQAEPSKDARSPVRAFALAATSSNALSPLAAHSPAAQMREDEICALLQALSEEERKRITYSLGHAVLYHCNRSAVVLPAALVGTVLLTHYQRGMRYSDLVRRIVWLQSEVQKRGGRVESREPVSLSRTIEAVLDRVLSKGQRQSGLVKRYKDVVMLSLYSPAERMELSLYRNQLIHAFVPESLILCSLYAFEKALGAVAIVERDDLLLLSKYLSALLKREFIFKQAPSIQHNFNGVLERLMERQILSSVGASAVVVNSEFDRTPEADNKGTVMYLFLCALLWPFIDSYWLSALSLFHFLPSRNIATDNLVGLTQQLGELLYFEGQVDLYEAVSKETIGNAFSLFVERRVLEAVHVEGRASASPILRLTPEYRTEDSVMALVSEISLFKKRSRAYRSRRYKGKSDNSDILDAIRLAKQRAALALA